MVDFQCKSRYGWEDFLEVMRLLRAPGGCPWDAEQTHQSIRRNFLEETCEALDTLDRDDAPGMCEELGDVLMQVAFHAQIEAERGRFAMEDVVASTVESVLEERRDEERRYQRQYRRTRRKQEKLHKSKASRAADPEEIEEEEEPSLIEAAVVQKRRYQRLRRRAVLATALALLYWAPLALSAAGIKVPYYSEDVRVFVWASAAVQGLVCLLGLPVFMEGFGRMQINCHTCVALSGLLTLADTVSVLFLEGRMEASPLGGIAAVSMCLSLWGECWRAGALREGFRLAAIGDPAYVVDLTESGAVKRRGRCGGFYSRSVKEDTASKWQRVLLPLVIVGSAVVAVLLSYGLERPRSAILTAGTALALPCVYSMPYSALAKRLGKSGCAVAGFYGAHQLSFSRELLVGDEDLFPPGSIRLKEVKVIREDERKAASYAGSLAAAYRCGWTNLLMGHLTDAGGQLSTWITSTSTRRGACPPPSTGRPPSWVRPT